MTRMTAKDFDKDLLELYDFYAHGLITKREFLDGAARFAVGGLTAMTILGMMSPDYAMAEQVPFTDPDTSCPNTSPMPHRTATARCAAIWCARRAIRPNIQRWWWCTRTAG